MRKTQEKINRGQMCVRHLLLGSHLAIACFASVYGGMDAAAIF